MAFLNRATAVTALFVFSFAQVSFADGVPEAAPTPGADLPSSGLISPTLPSPPSGARKRTFLLPPLASFFLPGFDQWWEGQRGMAAIYTGMALGGAAYSRNLEDSDVRHWMLGSQLTMAAGGYSLYHSFREAVDSRPEDFPFLKHRETQGDLALAPFRVSYFTRMTTLIPLMLAAGIAFVEPYQLGRPGLDAGRMNVREAYFDTAQSYLAGTWEEQAFRGYMMPVFMHYTGSELGSNVLSSSVFAYAHSNYGPGFIPWYQFVMGFYLGYLCQKNEWTLGESIFVHSWWDFFLFLGSSMHRGGSVELRLPALQVRF